MSRSLGRVLWVSALVSLVTAVPLAYWVAWVTTERLLQFAETAAEDPEVASLLAEMPRFTAIWLSTSLPVAGFAFLNVVAGCSLVLWLRERGDSRAGPSAAV